MKLSEAIRLGAMMMPQAFRTLLTNDGACALGAALLAVGARPEEAVRSALTAEGVAAANVWGAAINRRYHDMLRTYREAFEDVYVLDVPEPGTKIFAALPTHREITRDVLLERTREIGSRHRFDYDLRSFIAGFRHSDAERLRPGVVLRDSHR